jgi:hypothetical protein
VLNGNEFLGAKMDSIRLIESLKSLELAFKLNCMETRGVSHCGLAIYIKTYFKAKEELWKPKYFTIQKYT